MVFTHYFSIAEATKVFIHSFALPETLGTNSYSGLLIDYKASNSISPTLLWDLVKLFDLCFCFFTWKIIYLRGLFYALSYIKLYKALRLILGK